MAIQLPIAIHELSSLGPSLFLTLVEVHIRIALLRVAIRADDAGALGVFEPLPFELQLGLVSTAVVEASRCMPESLHGRLVAHAEDIALQMLGAELVFQAPDAGGTPYPRLHATEPS